MNRKLHILTGLLAMILCFGMVAVPVAHAAETDSCIYLTWDMDSRLNYCLNADDYTWTIYDAEGNDLAKTAGGIPASAGYELTGSGEWIGQAIVTLTIKNNLDTAAELMLLFRDALATSASAIASTLKTESEGVSFAAETGRLVVQPGAEAQVTMTITAAMLQNAEVTITEEDNIAGWIQVQVVDFPAAPAGTISMEIESETEAPTEAPTEAASEEVPEEMTEAVTEEATEAVTEEPTDAPEQDAVTGGLEMTIVENAGAISRTGGKIR